MFNTYYKLDSFFSKLENVLMDHKLEEHAKELRNYKKRIDSSAIPKIEFGKKEYFGRTIDFPEFDNNFYNIFWDIERAKKIIKKNNLIPYKIDYSHALNYVDKTNINNARLAFALHNNEPIIMANYDPLNLDFVIDGNHRVYSRVRSKPRFIVGYVLTTEQSLDSMAGELFRNLFISHYNITKIIDSKNKGYELKDVLLPF